MPVTISSGLVALVASVRTYFTSNAVTATARLGWKQPTQQINQGPGGANRVIFIPSDPSGRGGSLDGGARQPGPRVFGGDTTARSLVSWKRLVTVSVWAVDTSDPHDEEKQIEAVEDLFEWTIRAVHAYAHADARWGEVVWTVSPIEHVFGRELRAALTLNLPMFDKPTGLAFPAPAITKVLGDEAG